MATLTAENRAGTGLPVPFAKLGVSLIALASFVLLLVFASRYGYFGDELYFLAAGHRLEFSYADQGPVLPLLAYLMDSIAPGSVFALRVPAALITAGAVFFAGLLAREFGGGKGAQLLSATAYASSFFLFLQGHMLATNTVDTALWVLITWFLVRLGTYRERPAAARRGHRDRGRHAGEMADPVLLAERGGCGAAARAAADAHPADALDRRGHRGAEHAAFPCVASEPRLAATGHGFDRCR
ncbi:ArnT family glycosyltransferase [Sciscionella sediminilitoris]|uniref:ArnT family glycosyltransferase n=1 Tax=Sciscionella sediminilitoris TaxID=1445613 RepID=UPI000A93BC77|nr:glycosyltransferase family 39 protein [Sciscionella sp. SE31]